MKVPDRLVSLYFSEWISMPPVQVVNPEDPLRPLEQGKAVSPRPGAVKDLDE